MTYLESKNYDSEAHRLVAEFGNPAGDQWPEDFAVTMTQRCVDIDEDYDEPLIRWQFRDGSAIVEINGFWDYGVHRDNLEVAEDLVYSGESPLYVWPENHDNITSEWQVPLN